MDTSQVQAIVKAGVDLLAAVLQKVTGNPNELRTKADECARSASIIGTSASTTQQVVNQLGQTWNGQSYDGCHKVTTELVNQLNNVLKQNLEQEAQRLRTAADELEKARSQVEQQQQSYAAITAAILSALDTAIKAAYASGTPWTVPGLIAEAAKEARQEQDKARQQAESIETALSKLLISLFTKATNAVLSGAGA